MKFTVQAYTLRVGDVLTTTGEKITAVENRGTDTAIATDDGNNYVIPNRKMIGIQE